ncbi:MAG: transporter substrate-binding domain-containing protein [Acidobacteria bacterium]|nr:transporter substrate-binding domain-containing protein [Acidobacteriota bacterium]
MRIHAFSRYPLILILLALGAFPAVASAREEPPARAAIRSAAEIDYPPFSFVNPAGNADGFSVELLRAALGAMGREVTFRTGTWAEAREWLERGEIRALPLVGRTPEREELYDFTVPYMTLHGAIVVGAAETGIARLEDLIGRRVAVMNGDNAEEFLRRTGLGIHIRPLPTFETALEELAAGRHDAVVVQRLVALRLIQKTGLTSLRVLDEPVEGFRQDFCFGVREGDRDTLALLNEGLAIVMADGTYRHLHAKWFAAMELASDRPLIIGGDRNFPPYEFLDERGQPAGYNVDLTRAIAREIGLDVEIRLGHWPERVQSLKDGYIDLLQGAFYSPARNLEFDFTQAHTVGHYVAVARKGEGVPPASVEELRGRRIVVEEGEILHDFALEQGLEPNLVAVADQETALGELAEGRHDCALVMRVTALHLIEKHGWSNLVLGKKPIVGLEYAYAAKKGRKALVAQFSEGLKALERSGEYRRIHDKWLGVYTPGSSLLTVLRYSAVVVVPLLLLLATALAWTWSLRRQVADRTRELRESLEKFETFARLAPVAVAISDEQGNVLHLSRKFTELFGYTVDDVPRLEEWWRRAYPDEELRRRVREHWTATKGELRRTGTDIPPVEFPVHAADGRDLQIEFRAATADRFDIIVFVDISERRRAEREKQKLQAALTQSQKMESVGRLAGGVAHDYNNMLNVIIGFAELALESTPPEDARRGDLEEILQAGRRSADITRQLLAFARRQTIQPVALDLNASVENMLKMLRRLIGEAIDLAWHPGPGLWSVFMDPSQLGQVLANLCVNARDAIADVGRITLETDNVTLDDAYCSEHPGFIPGAYVRLAVSDDGHGMDRETLANAFEPFFTTKKPGEGTGLGLATIYGIVKQNRGFINVYSEPGEGTTVRIYLPRHAGEGAAATAPEPGPMPAARGETVMVVEDEVAIGHLARTLLEKLGYVVLSADGPRAALAEAGRHDGTIDLLITDVVMPEMNGRDLADRMRQIHPEIRVLYMSGYTANVIAHHGMLDPGVFFIQKPFTNRELAARVRETLSGRQEPE